MHTEPLCPYCGKEDFAIKKVPLKKSTDAAEFIFCTSCGKIIGQLVSDYSLILESINDRLNEFQNPK
jgi:transcription elongation factor Elf1